MLTSHVGPSEQHEAVKRHVVLDGVAVSTNHPIRPHILQRKVWPLLLLSLLLLVKL
jgi:hypothetical protein